MSSPYPGFQKMPGLYLGLEKNLEPVFGLLKIIGPVSRLPGRGQAGIRASRKWPGPVRGSRRPGGSILGFDDASRPGTGVDAHGRARVGLPWGGRCPKRTL